MKRLAALLLCLALAACGHAHHLRHAVILPLVHISIAGGHGDPTRHGMPAP